MYVSNGVGDGIGQDNPGGQAKEEAPFARVGGVRGGVVYPDTLDPPLLLHDLKIAQPKTVIRRGWRENQAWFGGAFLKQPVFWPDFHSNGRTTMPIC